MQKVTSSSLVSSISLIIAFASSERLSIFRNLREPYIIDEYFKPKSIQKLNKLETALENANLKLKQNNAGVRIEKRGKRLSLKATLPAKPGSDRVSPHQQRISLKINFNGSGLTQAIKLANKLSSQLALNEFDWSDWIEIKKKGESIDYWLTEYEIDYWNRKGKTPQTETTWLVDYDTIFKKLDRDRILTTKILLDTVLNTEPNTRTRLKAVTVLGSLARFAGLEVDLKRYKGNYNLRQTELIVPSDREIINYYRSIVNPQWKFAFALLACYGISSHELYHCDLSSLREYPGYLISNYRKGHYGTRKIWCLYPEWWDEWQLYDPNKTLPDITWKCNRDIGSRVGKAFKRYNLCLASSLRHAWSIRALGFMPIHMAAHQQAHKVEEHRKTYLRWINEKQELELWNKLMKNPDRPLPPS